LKTVATRPEDKVRAMLVNLYLQPPKAEARR
jgi:hypothetical protein